MKNAGWYVCALLLIYVALERTGCIPVHQDHRGGDTVVVVTKYDTTRGNMTINNWQPRIVVDVPPGQMPTVVDTMAILRDYFATNRYDTTFGDSTFKGTVDLTVSKNRVQSFGLKWQGVNTTREVTLREAPASHLSVGAYVGGRVQFDWGPLVLYQDKKNITYLAGYSFADKSIRVGAGIRLK